MKKGELWKIRGIFSWEPLAFHTLRNFLLMVFRGYRVWISIEPDFEAKRLTTITSFGKSPPEGLIPLCSVKWGLLQVLRLRKFAEVNFGGNLEVL